MDYKQKYRKYKAKYLAELRNAQLQAGGADDPKIDIQGELTKAINHNDEQSIHDILDTHESKLTDDIRKISLDEAIAKNNVGIVEFLLHYGAKPEATQLITAYDAGNIGMFGALLRGTDNMGSNKDAIIKSLISHIINNPNPDHEYNMNVIRLMHQYGIDVHGMTGSDGKTLKNYAIDRENGPAIKYLGDEHKAHTFITHPDNKGRMVHMHEPVHHIHDPGHTMMHMENMGCPEGSHKTPNKVSRESGNQRISYHCVDDKDKDNIVKRYHYSSKSSSPGTGHSHSSTLEHGHGFPHKSAFRVGGPHSGNGNGSYSSRTVIEERSSSSTVRQIPVEPKK